MFALQLSHNACVQFDRTALHWAAANGHKDVAKLLIVAGADLDFNDKVNDVTHILRFA